MEKFTEEQEKVLREAFGHLAEMLVEADEKEARKKEHLEAEKESK